MAIAYRRNRRHHKVERVDVDCSSPRIIFVRQLDVVPPSDLFLNLDIDPNTGEVVDAHDELNRRNEPFVEVFEHIAVQEKYISEDVHKSTQGISYSLSMKQS